MKEKIKQNIMQIALIITTVLLIVLSSLIVRNHFEYKHTQREIETLKTEINNKSKLEIVQEQIKDFKPQIDSFKKEFEESKKIYETSVWYLACLEVEWELEIKEIKTDLKCIPYYDYNIWIFNESEYINLERFANYNIEQTKINFWLVK